MTLLRDDYNSLRIKKNCACLRAMYFFFFFFFCAKGNFKAAEPWELARTILPNIITPTLSNLTS